MYFHYRVTFTGYIESFCATTSRDLLTLKLFHIQFLSCPTHALLSWDYPLLSYELLNLITFPLSRTVTAPAQCHVNYHRGGKNSPHFQKSLTPIYLFTHCIFGIFCIVCLRKNTIQALLLYSWNQKNLYCLTLKIVLGFHILLQLLGDILPGDLP